MTPSENTWTSIPSSYKTMNKLTIVELEHPVGTGWRISSIDLTLSGSNDLKVFTYPQLAYVVAYYDSSNSRLRIKMPNEDTTLLIFHNGDSNISNADWRQWTGYHYHVESSVAGTYREEFFHTNRGIGEFYIHIQNKGGDDTIIVTIDDDTEEKQLSAAPGNDVGKAISLTAGKHKIKIEAGSSYTGGAYVQVYGYWGTGEGISSIATYEGGNAINKLRELKVLDKSVLLVFEGTAPESPDIVQLWVDNIWHSTDDDIIRALSNSGRKIIDLVRAICQQGFVVTYTFNDLRIEKADTIPKVRISANYLREIDLREGYENYLSKVTVYGWNKNIYGSASIEDPLVHREAVFTIPWIVSSEEAERYAQKILERYSVIREIGSVTLAGIFPDLIRRPYRVVIDSPLIASTELLITKVTLDFNNMVTRLDVEIPLLTLWKWVEEMRERSDLEGSVTCPSGCQSPCEIQCQTAEENVSCDPTCQSECQASCQQTCQQGCLEECELECEETCELSCQTSCKLSCQKSCESECQDTCESVCQTSCETTGCETACETGACESECEYECFAVTMWWY